MKHLDTIVIPRIASNWRKVAYHLDYEINMIQVIEQRNNKDPMLCCEDLMEDWLNTDDGSESKTWDTLLSCLNEIRQLSRSVEKIKNDLSGLASSM